MDRISSLPDGVISHILSFLPTKKAARTSVLSKRWRILFAFSPNLDLKVGNNQQSFIDFVDRLLAVSGDSPIKKFALTCRKGSEPAHFDRWICDVLNRGVLVLDLAIYNMYPVTVEVFTCKTIVKLTLFNFLIEELPVDAFLPALKYLFLDDVQFGSSLHVCAFEKLLSACPVLEDLVIFGLKWEQWKLSRTITSRSLRRLTIDRTRLLGFDGSDFGSITFDTPSVTCLYYSDFVPGSYPVVNLDSLVDANLDLVLTVDHTWDPDNFAGENDEITSDPTQLIKGLRNVKFMDLQSHETLEMFYLFREAIPVFENLVHLSITTDANCCWRGLPFLLNKSPNLETLTIKGALHDDKFNRTFSVCKCFSGYPFLLSCPLKDVTIPSYSGTTREVEQLKQLLGKLSCLELLEVKIQGKDREDKFEITKGLLMLPRASTKCKIKVSHALIEEDQTYDSSPNG